MPDQARQLHEAIEEVDLALSRIRDLWLGELTTERLGRILELYAIHNDRVLKALRLVEEAITSNQPSE